MVLFVGRAERFESGDNHAEGFAIVPVDQERKQFDEQFLGAYPRRVERGSDLGDDEVMSESLARSVLYRYILMSVHLNIGRGDLQGGSGFASDTGQPRIPADCQTPV